MRNKIIAAATSFVLAAATTSITATAFAHGGGFGGGGHFGGGRVGGFSGGHFWLKRRAFFRVQRRTFRRGTAFWRLRWPF